MSKTSLSAQFDAQKRKHGSAVLALSNFGGIEIVLNDSNDGILYKYYGKICRRWQEIKETMGGRSYIMTLRQRFYLDTFMRV